MGNDSSNANSNAEVNAEAKANAGAQAGEQASERLSMLRQNGHIDIMHFDFHAKDAVAGLKLRGTMPRQAGEHVERLKAFQRVMRVYPDEQVADRLIAEGLDSAHKIAAMPEHVFVREYSGLFGGDKEKAEAAYKQAAHIKTAVSHLYGTVKDMVASPYYRTTLFSNTDAALDEYYRNIPSYQELFGSLDYMECDECASIFGPAAYFFDLMRITDGYITEPNTKPARSIPRGYTLEERRPDLFSMKLTCPNTTTVIPYLQVVNTVLQKNIESRKSGSDAFQLLAAARYPFSLPYQHSLQVIRKFLAKTGTTLADLFANFEVTHDGEETVRPLDASREALGLSVTDLAYWTDPDDSAARQSANYGYNIRMQPPAFTGAGTVGVLEGGSQVCGIGTQFTRQIQAGDTVTVGSEIKTVANVDSDTLLTVDGTWTASVGSAYKIIPAQPPVKPPYAGPGTISFDPDDTLVTGSGTQFTADFQPGDQIQAAGQTKTVVTVKSDTELEVDSAWPFITQGAAYTVMPQQPEPVQPVDGDGLALIVEGDSAVVGLGSKFTSQMKVGDQIQIRQETKKVAQIVSDTQLTVESAWSSTTTAGYNVTPQPREDSIASYMPSTGTGTVTFTIDSVSVTGSGTKFTEELQVGDQIRAGGLVRTVVDIQSDAALSVDAPWKLITENAPFVILPDDGIDVCDEFLRRTALTLDELQLLLNPGFSSGEMKAGAASRLFINDTGETGVPAYISTYFADDPENPVQRLDGLTLKRLDRISRFVRLARKIGWSFADLYWAMDVTGSKEITNELIEALAAIRSFVRLTEMPVVEATALWHDLKTWGKGQDKSPQDMFDVIFNNPNVLHGEDPYAADSNVPFNPFRDPAQRWTLADMSGDNATIRNRLRSALSVNDQDLTTTANYVLSLIGKEGAAELELNLTNLSWLYRLTQTAQLLDLTLDEYLNLLCQLFYPNRPYLQPGQNALPQTPQDMEAVWKAAAWLSESGFDIYQLQYITTGESNSQYDPGFTKQDIAPFIDNLAAMSAGAHLQPSTLRVGDITTDQAAQIYDGLATNSIITSDGIFLQTSFTFKDVAPYIPVAQYAGIWKTGFHALSFQVLSSLFTEQESAAVFQALCGHDPAILIELGDDLAMLNEAFNEQTDLSFLSSVLSGEDAELQIQDVRRILLTAGSNIRLLTTNLTQAAAQQTDSVAKGLSDFIDTSAQTVQSLLPFAASQAGLPHVLVEFMTPVPDSGVPDSTVTFIKRLSQWKLIVDQVELTDIETAFVTDPAGAAHFNIGDLGRVTLRDVETIADFKSFIRRFNDRNNRLIAYFQAPTTADKLEDKFAILSEITGWSVADIQILADYFWPSAGGSFTSDYDTVSGLYTMLACFDQAHSLKANIALLLQYCALSHLAIVDPNGGIIQDNWKTYEDAAKASVEGLGAKFKDSAFDDAYGEVSGELLTSARDALLGYAIWLINADDRSIQKPSDLYQYLLIDVEMCSCAETSLIAQGISSVQLYMQRCRMMLESGVLQVKVPEVWWSWMSQYRVWEVNRKIFLYPENYIEPSLRQNVSPEFRELSDSLMQTNITKDNVVKPFEDYMRKLTDLGGLEHVSSYNCKRTDPDTGEEIESLFLFARTNTQPYTYYFRTFDDGETWGPWEEIKLSIASDSVSPVYALNRIFIFWSEFDVGKSNSIKNQESNTQTVHKSVIKYSFLHHGEWVPEQVLEQEALINAFPNIYPSVDNDTFRELLDVQNVFWKEPYAVSTGIGLVGAGRVSITGGLGIVNGTNTQFDREVVVGDEIVCMGERRVVGAVQDSGTLVVTQPWTVSTSNASYKIIPSGLTHRFEPYIGTGTVDITKDLRLVSGNGTRFLEEFEYGDKITVGDETRVIIQIQSDTEMLVDNVWMANHSKQSFTVVPQRNGDEQILLLYGAALTSSYSGQFQQPIIDPNPNKDTFIAQRNELNRQLYNTLRVAQKASPKVENTPGLVTIGTTFLLDGNLSSVRTRLLVTDYQFSANVNPKPFKFLLDRFQERLRVELGTNLLGSNYWSNNISSAENLMISSNGQGGVNLLYYISEDKSSIINVANQPGWFIFTDEGESFLVTAETGKTLKKLSDIIQLQPTPLPPDMMTNMTLSTQAYTTEAIDLSKVKFKFTRLTTNTIPILNQRLFAGGIDNLLTIQNQMLPELPFSRFYPAPGNEPPSSVIPPNSTTMDFDGAYGLYFWEIFFHAPFLIAARLNENQRFEDARLWLQYVFNPTQQPAPGEDPKSADRFWRFLPFRTMDRPTLQQVLTDPAQIRRYNFDPFDPDAIASHRHVAYAKAIVLRYIDVLLDWGDYLFAQDTSESINQATNLYVMAADLLGPRPQSKGKMPTPQPKSFNEIKGEYPDNGIPQFLIELENTPEVYWNAQQTSYSNVPYNDIHAYFCVPENADLMKYWDRVEDRLYKIRHCMNIEGIVRALALFAPPIDPRALIRAVASGGLGMALSAQLAPSLPYYRFDYLLEKAKSLTGQLASLGSSLLSALEKKDAEALNLLKVQQEKTILKLTTTIREQEVEDVKTSGKALAQSLNQAKYRQQFYADLIKNGISQREQTSMDAMAVATVFNVLGSVTKTAASIGYAVPQAGSPFAMTYGGQQIGNALNAASGVLEIGATISSFLSQQALTMAGYDRRKEEWTLQEKLASYEVAQLTEQIAANDIRLLIAEQSLKVHQESIKQNEETEQFFKSKFTNKELYQWLSNRLSTIYFQTYSLAYEMALAAQKAYQYEYNSDQSFINYGYWEDRYKGLGAAEALFLALNQMEKAAIDKGERPLEIEKNISLMQLNPKALLDLKEKGECLFEFGEKLFDYDFPGHYARKIKSVSVSIPAIIGPYQNINATLTQMGNHVVLKADDSGVNAVNFLLGGKNAKTPATDALRTNWSANQRVALTRGVNDNGLFELTATDSRYLPFEGTGAVSSWKLSMPKSTNRFNFDTISDVIVTVKYTAVDGGATFRDKVLSLAALKPFTGIGYLNFQQMYSEDWFRFMNDHTSEDTQTLLFAVPNMAPPHVDSSKLTGFYVKLNATVSAPGTYMSLQITDTLSVDIDLSESNEFSYNFKADGKQPPALNKFAGQRRSITFNLKETPSVLKAPNSNYLDPNILDNIQVVVYYDGTVKM